MRYLAPCLLVAILFSLFRLQAGETSIEAAVEKARQRAGAPAADAQAKKEKAREAAQQNAREEAARREREEAARKAKAKAKAEAENAAFDKGTTPAQTTGTAQATKLHIKVFTLKDGRQIQAVMVVELDGTYALKDKDGKLEEVKKEDVESIKESSE